MSAPGVRFRSPSNRGEATIAGRRDVLNTIHLGYVHLDFRRSNILRLNKIMMSIAGYKYSGKYKTDDIVILEADSHGQQRVCFQPPPMAETSQAMNQLELAYMATRSNSNINQFLFVPFVSMDFLSNP